MQVALYNYHIDLPFSKNPRQKIGVFVPNYFDNVMYTTLSDQQPKTMQNLGLIQLIQGLHNIPNKTLIAHISIGRFFMNKDLSELILQMPEKIWVQITTNPSAIDKKNSKVQVQHVWGKDNKKDNPFDQLGLGDFGANLVQKQPAQFWEDYFQYQITHCNALLSLVNEKPAQNSTRPVVIDNKRRAKFKM